MQREKEKSKNSDLKISGDQSKWILEIFPIANTRIRFLLVDFSDTLLWLSHEFVGRDVLRDRGLQLINVPFRFIQTI